MKNLCKVNKLLFQLWHKPIAVFYAYGSFQHLTEIMGIIS